MAYILYHGTCYDGFGAAWAYRKGCIAPERPGKDAYLPCTYGQPMPEVPDGQDVVIVDYSYPEEALRSLARRSRTVTLLDHHKTAQDDLRGLLARSEPNMEVVFDMNHSGAYLAWQHFVGGEIPQLILYIEDRDLWKKELPYHEQITAWIQSFERTFQNFDTMEKVLEESELGPLTEGSAILRFKTQKVKEICDQMQMREVGGYNIPVVNCPYVFASDVANELLDRWPEFPFAGYYFDRGDGMRQWGLRSKGFDCSAVAKSFGGGGHVRAAGFEEKL